MKAVILAAGIGSRIRPLTNDKPKSLLSINGKTILQRMLENIKAAGLTQIIIITGYLENQIKNFVLKEFPDLDVNFCTNNIYHKTNTAYSLLLAKDFVANDDFIKFDADVVFELEILKRLVKCPNSALAIDRNINLDAEEIKVRVEKGKIVEVGKKIKPSLALGESIGIEKVTNAAAQIFLGQLELLMQKPENFNEYYDDSYPKIVEAGLPFEAVDITGLKWVEIDTLQDYELAQKTFSKN